MVTNCNVKFLGWSPNLNECNFQLKMSTSEFTSTLHIHLNLAQHKWKAHILIAKGVIKKSRWSIYSLVYMSGHNRISKHTSKNQSKCNYSICNYM
jgi:hypothetical protein